MKFDWNTGKFTATTAPLLSPENPSGLRGAGLAVSQAGRRCDDQPVRCDRNAGGGGDGGKHRIVDREVETVLEAGALIRCLPRIGVKLEAKPEPPPEPLDEKLETSASCEARTAPPRRHILRRDDQFAFVRLFLS